MTSLAALRALRQLQLCWLPGVTDAAIATLADSLTALQHVDLRLCEGLGDASLAAVATLPRLRTLDVSFCERLTDDGLLHLVVPHSPLLTTLRSLNLRNCRGVRVALPMAESR